MKKLNKNDLGFSAVEILLVLVIIGLLGVVGWMVYRNHNKTTNSVAANTPTTQPAKTTNPATVATDPYDGWKENTLKLEKLSFKYPSNWTLKDIGNSAADSVYVSAPNESFGLTITDGTGSGVSDNNATKPLFTEQLKVLGQPYYLNYYSSGAPQGEVSFANLTNSPSAGASNLADKNVQTANDGKYLLISIAYADSDPPNKPLVTFQKDANTQLAKQIIQSMAY